MNTARKLAKDCDRATLQSLRDGTARPEVRQAAAQMLRTASEERIGAADLARQSEIGGLETRPEDGQEELF